MKDQILQNAKDLLKMKGMFRTRSYYTCLKMAAKNDKGDISLTLTTIIEDIAEKFLDEWIPSDLREDYCGSMPFITQRAREVAKHDAYTDVKDLFMEYRTMWVEYVIKELEKDLA